MESKRRDLLTDLRREISSRKTQHEGILLRYKASVQELSMTRRALSGKSHALAERVKELGCLYGLSRLSTDPNLSQSDVLQQFVDILPPSWQYPEAACARIVVENSEFKTRNYRKCEWTQQALIKHGESEQGLVEVGYLSEKPENHEGPFMREERELIDTIAEQLGEILHLKRVETALLESKSRYMDLYRNAPVPYLTIAATGAIKGLNNAAVRFLGYPEDELVGKQVFDIVAPDAQDKAKALLEKLQQGIPFSSVEMSYIRKDGKPVHVLLSVNPVKDRDGKVLYSRLVLVDITARRAAEQQLKLFRELIDQSNDAIFIINPETGRFLDANNKASDLLGYTREELLGLSMPDIEAEVSDKTAWKARVKELRKKGHLLLEGEHRRKDGSGFPIEKNVRWIRSGRNEYLVAVVRDITRRRRSEETIRRATRDLRLAKESAERIQRLAPTAILTLDTELKITSWNARAAEITGFSQEEVLGKKCLQVFGELCGKQCWLCADERGWATRGKEFLIDTKNGERRIILKSSEPIRGSGGNITGGIETFEDITALKAVETELKKKAKALETVQSAVAFADMEGRLTSANPRFLELFGWETESQALGRPLTELLGKGVRFDELLHQLRKEGSWTGGMDVVGKDGIKINVELSASIVEGSDGKLLVLVSIVDVTRLKNAQRELKASVERLGLAQADIRALGVELVKERAGCLKSSREALSDEEKPLRRRMDEMLKNLSRAHDRFRGKIREAGVTDTAIQEERERLEQTVEELRKLEEELAGKEDLLRERTRENARLEVELKAKSAERERLAEEIGGAEELITQKKNVGQKLAELESEIARRKESLGALRQAVVELEGDVEKKKALLGTFKNETGVELPKKEAELKEAQEEAQGLEAALAKYKSRLAEFDKELPNAGRELAEIKERTASLVRQKGEALARIEKLRVTIRPLKPHFLRKEEEMGRVRERSQELEKEIQGREKALRSLKDAAAKLQSEKDEQADCWRTLTHDLGALRTEIELKEREGERTIDEIRRLKNRDIPGKRRILEETKKKRVLEEALKRRLTDRLESLGKELRTLEERKEGFFAEAEWLEHKELPLRRTALKKIASEIAEIEGETKKRGELIAESERGISQAEKLTGNFAEEDSRLKDRIQESEAAKRELEEILAGLDCELGPKKAHLDELSRRTSDHEAQRKKHVEALKELGTSIASIKNGIATREGEQQKLQEESENILARLQAYSKENEKISMKLVQAKAARENLRRRFRELNSGLRKQEENHHVLLAEIAPKKTVLDAKQSERRKVEGEIHCLEEEDIPQIEEELKKKRAEVRLTQVKLRKFEEALASLERGVHPQYDKLIELKKRASLLKAQLEESLVAQSRLSRAFERRGEEICRKRAEREELSKRRVELESEISAREEALRKSRRPLGFFIERLEGTDELLDEANRAVRRERRLISRLLPVRWSRIALWLALASLMGSGAAAVIFRLLTR